MCVLMEAREATDATIHSLLGVACKIRFGEEIMEIASRAVGLYMLNAELYIQ